MAFCKLFREIWPPNFEVVYTAISILMAESGL